MVVYWDLMGFTLWCHQTWLAGESPLAEWMFLARRITDQWSIFQHAMFEYQRVALGSADVITARLMRT